MGVSVENGLRGEITLQAKRREGLLSRKRSSVRGRGAVASRPWGDRVLGAGRSNRGRGAMKIKEEETTFLLKKTTFKEKKTGVVFGCFCWKWGGGGITLHKKIPRIFCPRISRIFVQASAEPNLFELCREQPKMSKKSTRIHCSP